MNWPKQPANTGIPPGSGVYSPDNRFVFYRNRRYLNGISYLHPVDDQESERQDQEHYYLKALYRASTIVPLDNPAFILDIGCGNGRWAMEMASDFTNARVVGIDLLPTSALPSNRPVPHNYQALAANILDPLPFADKIFDFVHMRSMIGAIPIAHWHKVVQELHRVTRLGGWIELVEQGPISRPTDSYHIIQGWLIKLMDIFGLDLFQGPQIALALDGVGCAYINARQVYAPIRQAAIRGTDPTQSLPAISFFNMLEGIRPLLEAYRIVTSNKWERTLSALHAELAYSLGESALHYFAAAGQRTR
jgi:SAM-dependent methyltransferase